MGYRLHYATTYDVSLDGGFFNWDEDKFRTMANAEDFLLWADESGNAELSVEGLQNYVKKLQSLPPDEVNQYFVSRDKDDQQYTNKEVLFCLQEMLNGYDKRHDFIRCSWF